jgi:hypothetical protein
MEKKKKIISYENLDPQLQVALRKKYPAGYAGHVQKLQTPKETFTVVPLETKDALYMVKVKYVEKKAKSVDDEEEEFFGDDEFTVPDAGGSTGFDGEKDEFGDEEEEDNYGDKPEEGDEEDED